VHLKNTTKNVLENGKKIRLTINEDKTKYMVITRNNSRSGHLDIVDYKFEREDNFKYLGVYINQDANSHNEINIRLARQTDAILDWYLFLNQSFFTKIKNNTVQSPSKTSSLVCM
jgi:hypothetical protein